MGIYKRLTDVKRAILNTSYHTHQYNVAYFGQMVERSAQISKGVMRDTIHILAAARLNEYADRTIDSFIEKHKRTVNQIRAF